MWAQLIIALVMMIISYVIAPRPKARKPEDVKDLENPTAEAGRPVPVVFGTITVKGLNVLWFGDKSKRLYKVPV